MDLFLSSEHGIVKTLQVLERFRDSDLNIITFDIIWRKKFNLIQTSFDYNKVNYTAIKEFLYKITWEEHFRDYLGTDA